MGLFTKSKPTEESPYKKIKEEGCLVSFSVEVPAAEVESETQTRLVRIQQRARIPGFRAGKAPMEIIQKRFTHAAREEAVEGLLRRHIPRALERFGLSPVAPPRVTELSHPEAKSLRFSVAVEITPQAAPRNYAGISVLRSSYPATDAEFDKRLGELREGQARLEASDSEALESTHYAVVDSSAVSGGKPLPELTGQGLLIDMSSDETARGLAQGLAGLRRGETREVKVDRSGAPALLTVTLREIKRKTLPPIDDDFARDLGFGSLLELRGGLREMIEKEGRERSEREVLGQIEEALLAQNRLSLPPSLVEAQSERLLERLRHRLLGPERQWSAAESGKLKEQLRPQAEKELSLSYILRAIAEQEKIEVTDADLESDLARNLETARSDRQKEEVRRLFAEGRDAIRGLIRDRKTMAFLKEKAVIKES